jgi:hypothetical protein
MLVEAGLLFAVHAVQTQSRPFASAVDADPADRRGMNTPSDSVVIPPDQVSSVRIDTATSRSIPDEGSDNTQAEQGTHDLRTMY